MADRINVLSVRNVTAFGGPDTTLLGWYGRIDRERFAPSLAWIEEPGTKAKTLVAPLEALGVETHAVPYGARKNVLAAVRRIVEIVRERRIDVLHTHDYRTDMLGYFAARWAGIPVMSTVYVWFAHHSTPKIKYLEAAQRLFLRRFDGVTAICESVRRDTIERYGFPASRVTTILSGIDVSKFSGPVDEARVRTSLGAGPDDRLLPYVARLWPEKAHTYLLQAMSTVVAQEPKARLVLVGDGIIRDRIEAETRERGLQDNVIVAGIRSDVPDILQVSEFMVHPSLAEGIPLAVYEGMAAGLAVVGTSVDGIPEVVSHEKTGLIVPPKDVPALASAILRLLRDVPLRKGMGTAARALMAGDYSLDNATRQLEAYYRGLRRRGRAPREGEGARVVSA